jgi:hypothetical protein
MRPACASASSGPTLAVRPDLDHEEVSRWLPDAGVSTVVDALDRRKKASITIVPSGWPSSLLRFATEKLRRA